MEKYIEEENGIHAYKAMNTDMTCKPGPGVIFKYEVGKKYHQDGVIELCTNGFHACKDILDVFRYYPNFDSIRMFEVVLFGTVVYADAEDKTTKLAASDIRIIKEIPFEEVLKLSNKGTCNYGVYNFGSCNLGSNNTGDCNEGDLNTGCYNIGTMNSGRFNIGICNSGSCNIGNYNSGYANRGSYNSGCFNIGDYNTGSFNTKCCNGFCLFNKPAKYSTELADTIGSICSGLEYASKPLDFVPVSKADDDMERSVKISRGNLVRYTDTERRKRFKDWLYQSGGCCCSIHMLLSLPNFNFAIWKELTGLTKKDTLQGIEWYNQWLSIS